MLSTKRPKLTQKKLLPNVDLQYVLPLAFLILAGVSALNFLFLFFLSIRVHQLAKKDRTFVQLINGQAVEIREEDKLYRHPEVIKNVVRQWAELTFNWDGFLSGTNQKDTGYKIGSNKRVPLNAYFASYLLQSGEKGFRTPALQMIAELTPSSVFSGNLTAKIIVNHLGEPKQIKPGYWQVDLVSTRVLRSSTGKEKEVYFNKRFFLKATDIPNLPKGESNPIEQRIYQIKIAGLEILKIGDLTEEIKGEEDAN
jgi:hypothetical protein